MTGENKALRHSKTVKVTIAAQAAVSGVIDLRLFAGGIVMMPAVWTAADLGFHVCDTVDGTFIPLADRENGYGTDVSIDAAAVDTAYPLPPFVFAAPFIKMWSNDGAGADEDQGADRILTVMLKS